MRASRAILVGLVVSVVGCVSPTATSPSPTIVGEPSATPSASPSPGPVLNDRFGFIIQDPTLRLPPAVRRESDPQPIFTFGESFSPWAVAPNGRQVAYWAADKVHVLDVAPNAQPRVVLDRSGGPGDEAHGTIAWSSDGTGLVVATSWPASLMAVDANPEYSTLMLVEVSGGPPREILRVPGLELSPLSWDREARVISAYGAFQIGVAAYYVIQEGGTAQTTELAQPEVGLEASSDARQVLASDFTSGVVRVWPVAGPAWMTELRSSGAEGILTAKWRPGTTEIAVVFSDRLELWQLTGGRRVVPLPPLPQRSDVYRLLAFRSDGSAAFVGIPIDGHPDLYTVAIELASGRSAVVATGGPLIPVRLSP